MFRACWGGRVLPSLCVCVGICLVIGVVLLALYSRQATPAPDSPTSTQAPVGDSNYWTKERIESAIPAPLLSP